MNCQKTIRRCLLVVLLVVPVVWAKERRARPPRFGSDSFRGVFFEDLAAKVPNSRPSVTDLKGIKPQVASPATGGGGTAPSAGGGEWSKLAAAQSIEDEIKRQKQLLDGDVAQPGRFKSGGYKRARLELSILATLFGVVTQYEGEIRWKSDAEAAKNLMARSAGNCNSGAIQVFNECKTRKQDLDDLLRGSKINSPPAAESTWADIADRSLLMEYLDALSKEELPALTNNDTGVKESPDDVRRLGDMVALIGHVLIQDEMDDFDDDEYASLAKQMRDAAVKVGEAVERGDADGARKAVGAINQSCDACHEQYR